MQIIHAITQEIKEQTGIEFKKHENLCYHTTNHPTKTILIGHCHPATILIKTAPKNITISDYIIEYKNPRLHNMFKNHAKSTNQLDQFHKQTQLIDLNHPNSIQQTINHIKETTN